MELKTEPIKLFASLYKKFSATGVQEASAATLATSTTDGKPSARVVLVKEFDDQGFVFYTNLHSRKAKELQNNPHAALCFYWEPIHHQVRVEGSVVPVPDEEADAYFATRPRNSQIGAWASQQSAVLESREFLKNRFEELMQKFKGKEIPRPPFWSGFKLYSEKIEFWERREFRLHARISYTLENNTWVKQLLFP